MSWSGSDGAGLVEFESVAGVELKNPAPHPLPDPHK